MTAPDDAADAARWRALVGHPIMAALLDEYRAQDIAATSKEASLAVSAALAEFEPDHRPLPYETVRRRRYFGHGDVHRAVAHRDAPCPRPPCWCWTRPGAPRRRCPYPECRRPECDGLRL